MKTTFLLFTIALLISTNIFAQPGTLDSSFGVNGESKMFINNRPLSASLIAMQDDGKIIVAGNDGYYSKFFLARLLLNGSPDSTFGINGKIITNIDSTQNPYIHDIIIQQDGKILLGGKVNNYNDFLVVRYKIDGQPDSTFGVNGQVITSTNPYSGGEVLSLAIQNDGKIIAVGDASATAFMVRYNINGSVDSTFTNGLAPGFAYVSVKALPDGKFVTVGEGFSDTDPVNYVFFNVKRFLNNGTPDTTFGVAGNAYNNFLSMPKAMALLKNNDMIAVGTTTTGASTILKFKSNGIIDSAFGVNGAVITNFDGYGTSANSVLIQDDGKIIITTREFSWYWWNTSAAFRIGRFLANGAVDSSFGTNGFLVLNLTPSRYTGFYDADNPTAIQKDGKILIVGSKDFGYFTTQRFKGDEPITISIKKNVALQEGNSGNSIAKFIVALNKPATADVSVNFTTKNGTALSGSDYISTSGSLIIKAGKVSKNILVSVLGDNIKEPNEKFSLVLSNPVNAILGDLDSAICTIKNDDPLLVSNVSAEEHIKTNEASIKVYPNPAKETIRIQGLNAGGKTTISILDMQGNTIIKTTTGNSNFTVNVKKLAPGTYYAKIDSNIKTETIKFIKE